MKRLHVGASRFERLPSQILETIADPSWIHLGDSEVDWKTHFKAELQQGKWISSARAVYRAVKPLHTPQELKKCYSKTDFREFYYQAGDKLDFEDNTFDFIFSEHFLEHLFMDEALELLKEFHRILKPYGVLRIIVPDYDLRTYEKIEPLGKGRSWTHPERHKTRWSIYSLPLIIKMAGLMPRPIMYCDKYGKFFNVTPSESDLEYQQSEDKRFIFSLDYIQRLPSLIVDGIKIIDEL
ncbi:MAG: methyltransferase domain-containing protein [Xenococcaceae cyanobacterium MO_167.B27]|nr:methyltransferase domain-containing protein [Xenococcaceae cyanobacterium MO_167.B27]